MKGNFYITTPIYYVNDIPHIGHAYTTIAADVVARYRRMDGYDVFFLTGTDEHGQKIEKTARSLGEEPKALADRVVVRFKELWKKLLISNDDFIRTTEPRHKKAVEHLFKKVMDKGDIYLGEYEDWYCIPCESFWTEKELVDLKCPSCGRQTERLREESYFFRMSRYEQQLLKHIEENPDFIQPPSKRNEIISFVKEGLRDLSVSRKNLEWGIPVPGDPKHTIYVWFDALTNYLTAVGYPDNKELFERFWPADIHLIGKDILRFHAVYWPTFLMSAELPLPKQIYAHGWWTVEGKKMSKSLGNVVDPSEMADRFGVDQFRYFLLREISFGLDGDYSINAFIQRINSDLANDLGNLVSRVLTMIDRFQGGRIRKPSVLCASLEQGFNKVVNEFKEAMDTLSFQRALVSIWEFINLTNKYIDENQPWNLAKDPQRRNELDVVLYGGCEALRVISLMIAPFMPIASQKIWKSLGYTTPVEGQRYHEALKWGLLDDGMQTIKPEPIFPRVEKA